MLLMFIVLWTAAGDQSEEIEELKSESPVTFYMINGVIALGISFLDYAIWSYLL